MGVVGSGRGLWGSWGERGFWRWKAVMRVEGSGRGLWGGRELWGLWGSWGGRRFWLW